MIDNNILSLVFSKKDIFLFFLLSRLNYPFQDSGAFVVWKRETPDIHNSIPRCPYLIFCYNFIYCNSASTNVITNVNVRNNTRVPVFTALKLSFIKTVILPV